MIERADDKTVQFGALSQQPPTAPPPSSSSPLPIPPPSMQTAPIVLRGNRARLFGVVAAALVVVAAAAGVTAVMVRHGGNTQSRNDQQQVEAAIRHYYDVVRDKGLPAATAISCKEVRDASTAMPPGTSIDYKQDIAIEKIENVVINGDNATAQITGHAQAVADGQTLPEDSDSTTLTMRREDGQWRFCPQQE